MNPGSGGSWETAAPFAPSAANHRPYRTLTRRRLVLAAYGIFATILFVAFVSASFPYADAISTVLAPMGLKVVFERQAMCFPIGARLQDVSLMSVRNEQLLLQTPDVTVSPGLAWFFLGQLSIKMRAHIFGGVLDVNVRQSARTTTVNFELASLNLARIGSPAIALAVATQPENDGDGPSPYKLAESLSGELSGRGSAQLTGQDIVDASASMMLYGRDVKAALISGLPPLELGVIGGQVLLDQRVATFQNVTADGADGALEANGQILLAPNIANSTAQLTISLKPSAKGRLGFAFFLDALPHPPAQGPYHLQGLVRSLSLS